MKVLITDFAKQQLNDIYEYYKFEGYGTFGRKVRKDVIQGALSLKNFPNSGVIEPNLAILKLGHRYILVGNYKIIYRVDKDCIFVTDVFDTRRNPDTMMP